MNNVIDYLQKSTKIVEEGLKKIQIRGTKREQIKRMQELELMIDEHDCRLSPEHRCMCIEWRQEYSILKRSIDKETI